ncbi:hypothetical protein O181_064466 [Austropuccinia psidii MF-1]|uniref:Small ribosomal subunit protein mS29 n=1 Tax=Austropuccinia psidii MF-1 TaxID=1389203 RepID=A0A9Q3ETR1_9BASI|nr:hypothetical protein [Austropuccinia psidii MF-1]
MWSFYRHSYNLLQSCSSRSRPSAQSIKCSHYATISKSGIPSNRSKPSKASTQRDNNTGAATPGGPDPGRLVNPAYLTSNPIDFSSLSELTSAEIVQGNVGKVFKYSSRSLKLFENFSIPSSIAKDWKPLPVPITTLRQASVKLVSCLTSSKDISPILTLTGQAGTGKSTVLLHALSYAIQRQWIVLYIPDAKSLVDGQFGYEYCPKTQLYHQNTLSSQILNKLYSLNDLNGLTVSKSQKLFGTKDERLVEFTEEIPVGSPLAKLILTGIQQPHLAPIILDIALEELSNQTMKPVLLAIDGVQNLFKPTEYLDGSFQAIDSFALNVSRSLIEFARGNKKLSKGSTVLAASSLHAPSKSLAWETMMVKEKELAGRIWPGWSAYGELLQPVQTFPTIKVDKLERIEAAGIAKGLEVSKLVLGPLDDQGFIRHYVTSNGNAREFRREIQNQFHF